MYHANKLLVTLVAVLVFAPFSDMDRGVLASIGLSSSTHQVWEFDKLGTVLATSTITDVSSDGVDDIVVASADRMIYMIDGATGNKLWSYAAGDFHSWTAIMASVDASGDDKSDVLATTKNMIFMLDGLDGKQLWNFSASPSSSDPCSTSTRSIHTVTDIDGDELPDVVIVSGSGDGCLKDDSIAVFSLSTGDGQKMWEYSYEVDYHGLKEGTRGSSPAVAIDFDSDGTIDVAVLDDQNVIHLIDGRTGDPLETIELDVFGTVWNLMAIPDISGDGVEDTIAFEFIDGGGGPDYASLKAIDLLTADVIWQVKAGDGIYDGGAVYSAAWLPSEGDDHVAVTLRIENNLHLAVLIAESGEQIWEFDLGEDRGRNDLDKYYPVARVANLADTNHDEIAVGSIDSRLYLLDGMGGDVIWSHPIGGQISDIMSIELEEGQAYIVVEDQENGVRALAGMTDIETELRLGASAQTVSLSPLPERITVTGTLTPALRGEVVELDYIDPMGSLTTVPLVVGLDGSFTHVIEPKIAGIWEVTAQFNGEGYYLDSSSAITFNVLEEEAGSLIYRLEVEGSDVSYPIAYKIEGGNVTGMDVDQESKTLGIAISAMGDGILSIKIPRSVIDAWESSYQVSVDGTSTDFEEAETDAEFRMLSIPFTSNANEIRISGTYIVPEFPVSALILALAIITVIVVATYSRHFPRISTP